MNLRPGPLPPLHAIPVVRDLLPLLGLPEDEEVLVKDQVEVVLGPGPLLPRGLHLVLDLDDVLAEDEADIEGRLEDAGGDGHVVLVLARVPDAPSGGRIPETGGCSSNLAPVSVGSSE